MVRQFLLPLLGLALLATEAASAQTLAPKPAATTVPQKDPRTGRLLTARERRAAEKLAKTEAAKANSTVLAMATTTPTNSWSGWSDDTMPTTADRLTHRPTMNVSVAPGMPINQVGHGVTTDYHGRPLQRAAANTTLPTER